MKSRGARRIFASSLILLLATTAHAELVRVRVGQSNKPLQFTGLGLDVAAREDAVLAIGLPVMQKARVQRLQTSKGIPVWDIKYDGQNDTERVIGPTLKVNGEMLRMGVHPVPHRLELHAADDGRVDVVSVMDLDTYLAGVLPSEMPVGWPIEALKAQVIASRTYALRLIRERRLRHFHLESTVFDQVYKTVAELRLNTTAREKITRALRETSGEVLVTEGGDLIRSFYHADCGGQTELASKVWGETGSDLGTVKDEMCPQSPLARWNIELDRALVGRALAAHFSLPETATLNSVVIVSRTASHRVAEMDALFEGQPPLRLTAHEFRRAIGFDNVRSTQFSLAWQGRKVVLTGKGHGHGVGMCQYGAKMMAKSGATYREILQHYYPGTKIVQEPGVTAKANLASGKLVL